MTLNPIFKIWDENRWIRFLVTGGINTGFNYGIYSLLIYLGMDYYFSSLCALIVGIIFSFHTQASLVFKNSARGLFLRYVTVWGLLYLANTAMIGALIALGTNAYVGGALAIGPTVLLSYFLQKYFVFSADKNRRPEKI